MLAIRGVAMAKWTRESVEQVLSDKGEGCQPQGIQNGVQYRIDDGPIVNLYESTGKVLVQGKASPLKTELEVIFSGTNAAQVPEAASPPAMVQTQPVPNRVFIVYGHDREAREQLDHLLLRLRVEPIMLDRLPRTGATIIERLEDLTDSDFACVLLTPDDKGHKACCPGEIKSRARQNVVLELGMVLAKLGRERVAILHKGSDLELPSDISGLLYIPFNDKVDEAKNDLATALQDAGFHIQLKDLL